MKCSQVSPPEIGSQCRVTPNRNISSSANQNVGIACPITAMVSVSRSIQLLGFKAAITPSGIDSTSAKPSADAPRIMVVGMRWSTSAATGVRKYSESPKSPSAARPSHSKYWRASGRSKPYCVRIASMVSAVAPSPAMAMATSVERLTSRKHTSDTVSATSSASTARLSAYCSIGAQAFAETVAPLISSDIPRSAGSRPGRGGTPGPWRRRNTPAANTSAPSRTARQSSSAHSCRQPCAPRP